jgi:hypothetical protein|tara:strand:+ start:612 stop:764 length:153 start_codon:yes stop_codon:yes gene_type:complete
METKLEKFRLKIRQKRISKLEKELKQTKEDVQLLAELLTGALDDIKKGSA